MGNSQRKGAAPSGQVPQRDRPNSSLSIQSQRQQPSLSIFNCMAIQGNCCQDGELAGTEIDSARYHQVTDVVKLKKRKTFSPSIGQEQVTEGSENCHSEYNAITLRSQDDYRHSISSHPRTRIFSGRKETKGSANYQKITKLLDSRSQAFNNRNSKIMTGGLFSDTNRDFGTISTRQLQTNERTPHANTQRDLMTGKGNLEIRKIGTARSGRYEYSTPQEQSPFGAKNPKIKQLSGKIAMTEIARSDGDHSIPDMEDERRGFSPETTNHVPQELKNLDMSIDIEIQSVHSTRCYPAGSKVKHKGIRVKNKTPLFPELSRIKPHSKEVSKTKNEFKMGNVVHYKPAKRTSFNQDRNIRPFTRLTQIAAELPEEIQSFLEQAKGQYPTMSLQNGAVYVGEMKNQRLEGVGFWLQADNSYYFGRWSAGKRQGKGTYQHANGTMYKGTWREDQLQGFGLCRNLDGTFYEGEWHNMQPHGNGQKTFPDQSSYKGSFKWGEKSGFGTLHCPDGSVYKGLFDNNQINGHGMYTWPHGIQYEGMWVDNKKQGHGVLKWLDGSREYRGDFMDDERHGQGTYIWENGTKSYRGYWRNGLKDGVGYVRDEFDYVERKGLWFCGKLIKWMPMDEEDEGQDGESLKSADIREWEGPSGNFNEQKNSNRSSQEPRIQIAKDSSQRSSIEVGQSSLPIVQPPKSTPEIMQQKSLQIIIQEGGAISPVTNSSGFKLVGSQGNSQRVQPVFRKAAEEVKTLKTRRKPITRRNANQEQATWSKASKVVAQAKHGMIPLDNKVKLVSRDLLEFNHPEIYTEMEKKMLSSNELPSPQFNKNISFLKSVTEEEEKEEYFQFNPEEVEADESF